VPNPFPEEWLLGSYVVTFPVSLALPSGDLATTVSAAIGSRRQDSPTAASPARPVVTPVRAPRIGARSLFEEQSGVGLTPIIAWDAPAVGEATAYQVTLVRAVENPPPPYRPGWYLHAVFTLPGDVTTLPVPPGVLAEGQHFALVLKAVHQTGQDVRTAPYRVSPDFGFAEAVTSSFTP